MNKSELVEKVAQSASISKASANSAIDATVKAITEALAKGEQVTLVGFGTFSVASREGRKGRNPRTGEPIEIKASKSPKFKAGKSLRDAIV